MYHPAIFHQCWFTWADNVSRGTTPMKPPIKIKDHFLSKESFVVSHYKSGILKTEPNLNSKELQKYYNSDKYLSHSKSNSFLGKIYSKASTLMLSIKYKMIKKHIDHKSNIVDFGCGKGDFVLKLSDKGYRCFGVENNELAISQLESQNIKHYKSIEELTKKIDFIMFWHSLEHVSNYESVLDSLKSLTSKNAKVLIALPNYLSFDARYYGSGWAAFDVPRHRFHFSPNGLKSVMADFGFKLVNTHPLYLDAFYISMISEKYKNNKLYFFSGILIGLISNLIGLFNSNYSSSAFIFKKAI